MKHRPVSTTRQVMSTAQKWFTGIVTTIAAVMTLALNAKHLGLSPFLGLLDSDIVDYAARRIVLTPRADTLRAIGDTAAVVATVTDARGAMLAGVGLRWRTTDSSVASVDSGGVIIARGPGRATIEVSVRDIVAKVPVLVRQVPVALRVLGDSSVRLADEESLQLAAVVVDARGYRMPGMGVRWSAPDSQVVRVSEDGRVVALEAGRALLTASAGELSAMVPVDVVLTPATITLADTTPQRGLAGRALLKPVVLQVLTRSGQPVPGAFVALTTENGEGAISPANPTTDAQGRVRIQWSLGGRAGQQRLHARVAALDSAITIVAEADPAPRNAKVEVLTSELRGTAGDTIEHAARLRVTDTLGVALAGARVSWRVLDGGGITGASRTDTAGYAEATWVLGKRAGYQRLLVQVGDARYTPATAMRARAEEGPPAVLAVLAGDAQAGTAGRALAKPVVVVVRDSLGNPVAGAAVRAAAGAGEVADTLLTTAEGGRVSFKWTLGTKAGAQRLEVQLAGGTLRDTAVATARAGAPVSVALAAVKTGKAGAHRLTANVLDEHGNPVRNATLVFSAAAGKLSRVRAPSDSLGRAIVTWTPPAVSAAATKGAAAKPTAPKPVRVAVTIAGTKTSAELAIR